MRFILVLLLAIVLNFALLAQKSTPGFIVTLERDTIKGFILDGTDAELFSGITFKKKNTLEEFRYLPTSIYSFGFDYGRTFKQFLVSRKSDGKDSTLVFAKRSLEGKISMYTFNENKQNEPDIFLVNNYSHRTIYLKYKLESYQHIGFLKFIKSDSLDNIKNVKKFKYSEKAIRMDIQNYNERFQNEFDIVTYNPQINYFYDISVGVPVLSPNEVDVAFRVAVYRHKYFPEKSREVSFFRGISYRYSYSNSTIDTSIKDSNQNFRQQFLSLIPIGVNLQADSKVIKPYLYLGAGLALLLETNHHVVDYEDKGHVNELTILPTFNVGVGLKIKTGSNFIITEVSPTGNKSGTCINIGYSF